MRPLSLLLAGLLLFVAGTMSARASAHGSAYAPVIKGTVAGYRLAGVEPDGDPLYQVALKTRLTPSAGLPAINLIISAYLENFRPDTTPILPDLLHPKKTATNLGGFLDGKALLTDDAGNVLSIGTFLAEAFLDNTNHAVLRFYAANQTTEIGQFEGIFTLHPHSVDLTGRFTGSLHLSAGALKQLAANRGAKMKPLQKIIRQVTVVPHYYGTKGVHGSGQALHTGFGQKGGGSSAPATPATSGPHISTLTIVAGTGAIICLILAGVLYIWERRRAPASPPAA